MKLLKTSDLERNRESTGLLAKKTAALLHLGFESGRSHIRELTPTIVFSNAYSRLSNSGLMQKLVSYYY
jgi:hypothetical protein